MRKRNSSSFSNSLYFFKLMRSKKANGLSFVSCHNSASIDLNKSIAYGCQHHHKLRESSSSCLSLSGNCRLINNLVQEGLFVVIFVHFFFHFSLNVLPLSIQNHSAHSYN